MTVNYTVDSRKAVVQLAMDISLDEAMRGVWIEWCGIEYAIFDNVACVCDQGGCYVAGHEEVGDVVGVAYLVAVRLSDTVLLS